MKLSTSRFFILSTFLALGCRTAGTNHSSEVASAGAGGTETISVDVQNVYRDTSDKPIGIDLDYIVDSDANRPNARPLAEALKEMGVKYLRYPGGEKSDYQFWSTYPWNKANPQIFGYYKDYARNPLNFDDYMTLVRKINGEPFVVVGYDNARNTGKSKQEYLTAAVEWVRYANIKKNYHVKYWEIGNENWHNGTGSGSEMAGIVSEFARAMKAVDPSIIVGASGDDKASADQAPFWKPFIENGGTRNIDFLIQTNYPCQSDGCKPYRSGSNRNLSWLGNTANAINNYASEDDKKRLFMVVAEYNSIVWSKDWSNENDLIHALTSFDMLGQLLKNPKLNMAMFWTTRWLSGNVNVMFALDEKNNLTAQGQALKLWGTYLQDKYVHADTSGLTGAYASYSPSKKRAVVFLLNRETYARTVAVQMNNADAEIEQADVKVFGGDSASSWSPSWQDKGPFHAGGSLSLPALSVTVLDFHP